MKKVLKNFLIVNSTSQKLLNFRFLYFYPIQVFRNNRNKMLSKIYFNENLRKYNFKYPLYAQNFDSGKKFFISLASSKKNLILVRYQNFFFLDRIKTRITYFNFYYNFLLFSNNLVFILIFLSFLQRFTKLTFFLSSYKNLKV